MDNQIIKDINPIIVKQHNFITEARYEMSALQKNILYLLLAQLKDDDIQNTKYKLSLGKIKKIRSIRVRREELLEAARGLISSGLTISSSNQERFITIGILHSADYGIGENKDNLFIEFDSRLTPFLYHVKNRFTTFTLSYALNLKSKYSKRIYEMLSQFKDTGILNITVQELKERFGLIDSKTGKERYSDFNLFSNYVLETAKKEINAQTDISFTYITEKKGKGKKVTNLQFHIIYNQTSKKSGLSELNLSVQKESSQKETELQIANTYKKEGVYVFKPLTPELVPLYKRLRELALNKRVATLVVKNIPTKELESEINHFYNSVTQRKNKTTITPHFQDLLYRYAGIRVRQNYKKVVSILKREPTDMLPEGSSSVKDIDPVYTFCFNTLRSFGIKYADIQLLLTQASVDEVKNFLEEVCKELEKNKESDKATYVVNKFYTVFDSTNTKLTKQEKVQTSSEKLKNMLYRKHENLNNDGK